MDMRLRTGEGTRQQPMLLWDTVWSPSQMAGTWVQAGTGLKSTSPLQTAVVLCLFTDRRCPDDHPLAAYAGDDPRGWWGDGVDVAEDAGETEMGSLLWLLERAALTADTQRWAEQMARDALQPLITQKAVASVAVASEIQQPSRLNLKIDLFGHDGGKAYGAEFEIYWRSIR